MNNSNNILNELKEISPLLAGMQKANVFTVPNGYFENFPATMLLLVKEEKNSLLTGISQQNPNVPAGYFDTLADSILNKIKAQEAAEDYPLLNSISTANVYTVPQGYFENLADNTLGKIRIEEDLVHPVLKSISTANVYTVPQGYFETLSANILNAVTQQQATKVVTMPKRTINWFKYAVAAAFVGVMAFGAYQFIGSNKTQALPGYVEAGMQIKNVETELEKITDEDIIKYLQAEGSDFDAALVAGTIDEKELPTQEDYLMDEKALDKYLENIDLNDLKN